MKIIDIQRFINKFKVLTEAVTLPNIRQGILGKKNMREYPVIDSEKEWYENHKDEFLKTIEKVLNVDNKTLQNELQKFDTDPYFTNVKPRKLKPKELLKAVEKKFISQVERSRNTEEKTAGIEDQYEMTKMGNGVEVYAVYTPIANRHLTHTKLSVQGCFSPTWCIASSTASNYWNYYHLYEAEFPSVFIVAQKTKTGYNPIKYELKCDPHKSVSFKDGKISLKEWVDEWRDPEQNEEENSFEGTSLFDTFKTTPEDLQNTIRKLVNSKKAESFSERYGKIMIKKYDDIIKSNDGDENKKLKYLTMACKKGFFARYKRVRIPGINKKFFIDEMMYYDTLSEIEIFPSSNVDEKTILYLIKKKRCSITSLDYVRLHQNEFEKNMLKKVFHSMTDENLLGQGLDDMKSHIKDIFGIIKYEDGLSGEYFNFLIKKNKIKEMGDEVCDYINDDKSIEITLPYLITDEKVIIKTLKKIKNDDLIKKYIDILIKNDKITSEVLIYIHDEEVMKKCIDNLIQNEKIDQFILGYIEDDRDLMKKCIDNLIENNEINTYCTNYIKDKNLMKKCIDFLIQNDKIDCFSIRFITNDIILRDEEMILKIIKAVVQDDDCGIGAIKNFLSELNPDLIQKCKKIIKEISPKIYERMN